MPSADHAVRNEAFAWLGRQVEVLASDVLPWSVLSRGFNFEGRRVPLVSQQGIFKPAACDLPLSIRTSAQSPYDDHFEGNRLVYSYRGTNLEQRENAGLRRAMRERVPLVYLHAVVEGRYLTVWPVFIVHDEPERLRFWAQADEVPLELESSSGPVEAADILREEARREYVTREVRQRLHQRGFRERVVAAYRDQCAMCRLKHRDLLDAAHILPDCEGGNPVVSNGLSLCKIHHAAFDLGVLGVRPVDLRVQVRRDVLIEIDGPMLRYGLQALHGEKLGIPRASRNQPDPQFLRWRWERFQQTG